MPDDGQNPYATQNPYAKPAVVNPYAAAPDVHAARRAFGVHQPEDEDPSLAASEPESAGEGALGLLDALRHIPASLLDLVNHPIRSAGQITGLGNANASFDVFRDPNASAAEKADAAMRMLPTNIPYSLERRAIDVMGDPTAGLRAQSSAIGDVASLGMFGMRPVVKTPFSDYTPPAKPTIEAAPPIEPHPIEGLEQSRSAAVPRQPGAAIEPHPVTLPRNAPTVPGIESPLESALRSPSVLRAGVDVQQGVSPTPTPSPVEGLTHGFPAPDVQPEPVEHFPPFEENALPPEYEHLTKGSPAESVIDNEALTRDVPLSDDEIAAQTAEADRGVEPDRLRGMTDAELAAQHPLGETPPPEASNAAPGVLEAQASKATQGALARLKGEGGFVKQIPTEVSAWDGAKRLYLASMISGVTTLYKIAASNPIYVWWKTGAVRPGALLVDRVLRGFSGQVGQEPLGAELARAAAKRGAQLGWQEVQQILKGEAPTRQPTPGGAFQAMEDIGPLKNIPVLGPIAQAFAAMISRTHSALHRVGFARAWEMAATERAAVLTRIAHPGLQGPAFNAAVEALVRNPTPELDAFSANAAAEATLLNPNFVSRAVSGGVEAARRLGPGSGIAADAAATAIMPFARIGPNLVIQGLRASPFGIAMAVPDMVRFVRAISDKVPHDELSAVQGKLAGRLAEAGLGTATMFMLGQMLTRRGLMMGGTPRSPEEAQMWDALGIPPYGLNVGKNGLGITDKPDDYRQVWHLLGPLGLSLNMGAAWQLAASDPNKDPDEVFTAMMQPVAEEPTLRGLTDFGAAVGDVASGRAGVAPAAEHFVQERSVAAIPNILQETARQLDPVVRDPQTFGEIIRSALPVSHSNIAPKLGKAFGLPRVRQTSAFSPFPAFPTEGVPLAYSKPTLDLFARLATLDHKMNELNAQLMGVAQLPDGPTKEARLNSIVQQIQERVQALSSSPDTEP